MPFMSGVLLRRKNGMLAATAAQLGADRPESRFAQVRCRPPQCIQRSHRESPLARTIHEPGPPVRSRSAQDVAALAHGTYSLSHRARAAGALAATILERAVDREMV